MITAHILTLIVTPMVSHSFICLFRWCFTCSNDSAATVCSSGSSSSPSPCSHFGFKCSSSISSSSARLGIQWARFTHHWFIWFLSECQHDSWYIHHSRNHFHEEKAQTLLQIPDVRTRERISLQCLRFQAKTLGIGQKSQPYRATGQNLVSKSSNEIKKGKSKTPGSKFEASSCCWSCRMILCWINWVNFHFFLE